MLIIHITWHGEDTSFLALASLKRHDRQRLKNGQGPWIYLHRAQEWISIGNIESNRRRGCDLMVVLLGIRKVRRDVLSEDDSVVNIVGDSNESTIELNTLITTWVTLQHFNNSIGYVQEIS